MAVQIPLILFIYLYSPCVKHSERYFIFEAEARILCFNTGNISFLFISVAEAENPYKTTHKTHITTIIIVIVIKCVQFYFRCSSPHYKVSKLLLSRCRTVSNAKHFWSLFTHSVSLQISSCFSCSN